MQQQIQVNKLLVSEAVPWRRKKRKKWRSGNYCHMNCCSTRTVLTRHQQSQNIGKARESKAILLSKMWPF
ncbi:hypothetical protein QQG55_35125 [Brugia pahangi]